MSVKRLMWLASRMAVVGLALAVCAEGARAEEKRGPKRDWAAISAGVRPEALRRHITRLAACGSRIPGYPGHEQAARYLREQFSRMGYERIEEDSFPVSVPVEESSSLEVVETGDRVALHALWPNLVRTSQLPPGGATGEAVYVGHGEWREFDGKRIRNSVVFMEFNSDGRWLNAAMLGARAIVFVEPKETVRRQAEAKLVSVPLNMPKFWISREDFTRLRPAMGRQVRVKCRMQWRRVEGRNLRVYLKGQGAESGKEPVILSAYYDSMSVVPALAPGAESACGIAALLEIARALKANPPQCDVIFLAVSGHHVANAGTMAFMQQHARRRAPFEEKTSEPIHARLMVCLELSSRNATLGMTFEDGRTVLVNALRLYRREFLRHARLFESYAKEVAPIIGVRPESLYLNLVLPEGGGSWRSFLPEQISLDSTRALVGATPAVTLATIYDARLAVDTPLDRPERVNWANLTRQTRFLACALVKGLSDVEMIAPLEKKDEDRLQVFRGRLVTFDPTKGFMPNDPVRNGIGRLAGGPIDKTGQLPSSVGVRNELLAVTDDDGWFEIITGALPTSLGAGATYVEGYGIDPDTGDIVEAMDRGLEGAAQFPVEFTFDTYFKERRAIVLFRCDKADLYDLVDPRYLIPADKLSFFDPGNAEPFSYGYTLNMIPPQLRESRGAPYASVYVKPGMRAKFGVSSDVLGQRLLFLNAPSAADKKKSEGLGYPIGKLRMVERSSYQVLRDMYNLDEYRIRVIKRYGIKNRRLERLHKAAGDALEQAGEALKSLQWSKFIRFARRGLGVESRAYPDVRATADDVVKGIVFYMALLLPFAFFCERLFFAFPDLKRRIIAFVGFFFLTYFALRLVHPAFRIVETSEVILLGLIIFALCGIVVWISAGRFEAQMRSLKQRRGRVHYADVSRASATATAFALGVSNMRRRKVRTFLTCTAIVLLMFTVLSFTSVKTFLRPREVSRPNLPSYEGALIRDRTWVPMKFLALEQVASEFGDMGILARRSWLAPRVISKTFTQLRILLRPVTDDGVGERHINAFGLVGFDATEADVSGVNRTLKAGRWFQPGERNVCILPEAIAEALGISDDDIGKARIQLLGTQPLVIGIVNDKEYNSFRDLDNEKLTPLDFSKLSREELGRAAAAAQNVSALEGRAALQTFQHLDAENTVLMPYETVLDLGGALQSVAVKFRAGSVSEHVERLLDRLAVTVFVGEAGRTTVRSSLASSSVGGMGNILVPLLIAALMVLNTMSGSVHERLREIGTYSSVGLAPSHIGALFLAEACVYAILGGIAGYVIGQVVTKGLSLVGGLGGLTLNYSSLASVLATFLVMVTVIASTIYPARMASRMAVPDVTRKWKLPGPEGDIWHFDFPFTVSGKEVKGLYVFFRYYFASFEEQSIGRFYTTSTELSRLEENGQEGYRLAMRVWLAPYDLGVSQDVRLHAVPTGDFGVYLIRLQIKRLSGQSNTWVRINRGFLDELRKQFLLWRTLAPDMKAEYQAEAEEAFGREGAAT